MKNMNLNSAMPIIEALRKAYEDKRATDIILNLKRILFTATGNISHDSSMLESLIKHLDESFFLDDVKNHPNFKASEDISALKSKINKSNALCKEDFIERCYDVFFYAYDLMSNINRDFGTNFNIEDVIMIDEDGTETTILELMDSVLEVEESDLPIGIKSVFYMGVISTAQALKATSVGEKYKRLLDDIIDRADNNIEMNNKLH